MSVNMSVGQELLNVPFADMVRSLALAIADGQLALDMNSIQVAQELAKTELAKDTVIVAIEETVNDNGEVVSSTPIWNNNPMSLLAYGMEPRFYEFSESIVEVKITITIRYERAFETSFQTSFSVTNKTTANVKYRTPGWVNMILGKASADISSTTTVAFASTFNAKYSSKYSFEAQGTSLLRTTIRPVPAPARSVPKVKVKASTGS
jgi:hypothetical protein